MNNQRQNSLNETVFYFFSLVKFLLKHYLRLKGFSNNLNLTIIELFLKDLLANARAAPSTDPPGIDNFNRNNDPDEMDLEQPWTILMDDDDKIEEAVLANPHSLSESLPQVCTLSEFNFAVESFLIRF